MSPTHDDLQVCSDCLMMIANGDSSGMDAVTLHEVERGMARLCEDGGHLVVGDSDLDQGFSWRRCDCCDRHLGGDRFHCVLIGP